MALLKRTYDWAMRLASGPNALPALAVISFVESSFFPIPPDVMLVPMILARREQAWLIATVCTLTSVAGGVLGYAIGYFLYDSVGQWLIKLYGLQEGAVEFRSWYAEWGAAIILIKGLTPIPFKLVTIASGLAAFNFPLFVLTALITRGARFFLIAALLKRYGAPIQDFIERRLNLIGFAFLLALAGGFAVVALI